MQYQEKMWKGWILTWIPHDSKQWSFLKKYSNFEKTKLELKKIEWIKHTTRSFVFWMIMQLIEHENNTNVSLISFTTHMISFTHASSSYTNNMAAYICRGTSLGYPGSLKSRPWYPGSLKFRPWYPGSLKSRSLPWNAVFLIFAHKDNANMSGEWLSTRSVRATS